MKEMREKLISVFQENIVYSLVRGWEYSSSFFGGPLDPKVTGQSFGPKKLHHIATLSSLHLPVLDELHILDLPLVYGLCYDGCLMKYRVGISGIEIIELTPNQSADDWPYPDYPALLPFAPLELENQTNKTWEQFADEFSNLPEKQPSELVAVVPPPMTLGTSLWGHSGDAEEVTIVFECDLHDKHITTYNICS